MDGEPDCGMQVVAVEHDKNVMWASHACRHVPESDLDSTSLKISSEVLDDDPLTGRITDLARAIGENRKDYRNTLHLMAGCALQVSQGFGKSGSRCVAHRSLGRACLDPDLNAPLGSRRATQRRFVFPKPPQVERNIWKHTEDLLVQYANSS
eukprot:2952756-Pyramimonas_sp.AAC.1